MIRYVLRILGVPVLSLDTIHYELEGDEEETTIHGGSWHDFDRDVTPITPEDRYDWSYEDSKRFGFGRA